jgi:hypothetical protein
MFKAGVMRPRWFIWLPVLVLVLALAAIWSADTWLESPAGRERLEFALADALNLPVRLVGDFNISFWPAVGISGRKLEIGAPGVSMADGSASNGPLLQCDSYHVSVALWPLLQGRLIVLAVRATDGEINPGRLGENVPESPTGSPQPLRLPRVDLLQLENFQMPLTDGEDLMLVFHRLVVQSFQVDTVTPLSLSISIERSSALLAQFDIESSFNLDADASELLVDISRLDLSAAGWEMKEGIGSLKWNRVQDEIEWQLEGQESYFGKVNFAGSFSAEMLSGSLALDVLPPDHNLMLAAGLSFSPMPGGMKLAGVQIESADQRLSGHGCLRTGAEPSLHLDLEAAMIDLDRLQPWLPNDGGSGSGIGPVNLDLPLELNIQLLVDELRSGNVVARRVAMATGGQPDCSSAAD